MQFTEVIYYSEVDDLIDTLENMNEVDEEELSIIKHSQA